MTADNLLLLTTPDGLWGLAAVVCATVLVLLLAIVLLE